MLSIRHLSKTYANGVRALRDVSLDVPKGIFGLLGANGAGKTSLMRTIATLQLPDQGTITFAGVDALANPEALRRQLGYLPQDFGLYPRKLVLLALLVLAGCAKLRVVQEADSTAIRALLQVYEAAINRRDVDAAIATYVPDADVWVVGYERIAGIEAIRQNEERAVSAPGFQAWTTSVEAIRFVSADAAVVESSGSVSIGGDQIAERITWVVNRTVAGWRIAAVRIMAFERSGP